MVIGLVSHNRTALGQDLVVKSSQWMHSANVDMADELARQGRRTVWFEKTLSKLLTIMPWYFVLSKKTLAMLQGNWLIQPSSA